MASKLELTWYGKEKQISVEPRLLIEHPELSNTAAEPDTENMLIHGDNLLALKALESDYAGQVKCIYIDPPFNTGQAFEHYDDKLEHSIWLNLMYGRFQCLYTLLESNGMFWIHLDDIEVHYCKVLLDEIFSRHNFVAHITYERSAVAGLGQGGYLVNTTEHILLYRKGTLPNKVNLSYEELGFNIIKRYNRYVVDFGSRKLVKSFKARSNGEIVNVYEHSGVVIETISLRESKKRESEIRTAFAEHIETLFRGNRVQKENEFQNDIISELDKDKFYSVDYIPSRGKNKDLLTTLYYYNCELLSWLKDTTSLTDGMLTKSQKMTTLWKHGEIPKADIANEGGVYFPRSKKPEQLIKRIIEMSTDPGDLVLDSFLGSGTTAAVAHKMGRRYIGIEMGNHAYTHCKKRLDMVISGEDKGGISKAVNWQGGGGYRFYELAPTLINTDEFGEYIINPEYSADMLAAAMALHEGYTYSPDKTFFWKQSFGSEKSFLFVTTRHLNSAFMDSISGSMEEDEYLVIACCSYDKEIEKTNPHITVKKIPQMLLERCEFDKADYNLNIIHPPVCEDEEEQDEE
ncbi:MAG: site-specific DNA-methyltransferase [Acutalibacteraceae bacterium]|nr:site-specific DNA-methyltransferase [Acutalibacteraceae bacterium]